MKRLFIRSLVFLSMFSGIYPLLYAQGEAAIYGKVTAQADGSAIPDTFIQLEGTGMPTAATAVSGADGRFTFRGLVPGPYTLSASGEGFQRYALHLTLKPREVQNITMELALRGISESIQVIAPPEPVASVHSPGSTTFDREFVEKLPMAERNNLPDMIAVSAPEHDSQPR